jgi:hypothetical protein
VIKRAGAGYNWTDADREIKKERRWDHEEEGTVRHGRHHTHTLVPLYHQALCLSFYLFHSRESLVFSNQGADVSESDTFDEKELSGNRREAQPNPAN